MTEKPDEADLTESLNERLAELNALIEQLGSLTGKLEEESRPLRDPEQPA
jgi:hypothetical protein